MSRELKILVAEDNLVNQMVLSKILKKLGFEVELAKNGEEAVDKALSTAYDLILMDMLMPGKDGIEATVEIRNVHAESPIIVALTANVSKEDRDKCIEAGMNDFISKPISRDRLEELMNKWFSGVLSETDKV